MRKDWTIGYSLNYPLSSNRSLYFNGTHRIPLDEKDFWVAQDFLDLLQSLGLGVGYFDRELECAVYVARIRHG